MTSAIACQFSQREALVLTAVVRCHELSQRDGFAVGG